MSIPLHGVQPTLLPPEPAEAVDALRRLVSSAQASADLRHEQLRTIVAEHPAFLDGWAHLASLALDTGDPVAAYAFARTGYHRGLDRLRQNGWRGQGPVPWDHEPNQGFLRSLQALGEAAAAIGETEETERCRTFLAEIAGAPPGQDAGGATG